MPTTHPKDSPPKLEHDDWSTGLTDQELDHALDRVLAEITTRRGPEAAVTIGDAMLRRFC